MHDLNADKRMSYWKGNKWSVLDHKTRYDNVSGGIPIDQGSDRPIIEKGPLDRGSDRPIIEKGPLDRGSEGPIIEKGPLDRFYLGL